MNAVRVKICGITSRHDARHAVDAGAFAIGFNFHPPSPRYIEPAAAAEIAAEIPGNVLRVGVFVDLSRAAVAEVVRGAALTAVQFHGSEPPAFCLDWSVPVIKALRVRGAADVAGAAGYAVDFVLLDTYVEGTPGGTGRPFDWAVLGGLDSSRVILAGGLTPENVAEAVRRVRPYAVDVASGVERRPGVKDPEKVRAFIANAQAA